MALPARFGNASLFLGILALAAVMHTGSARADGAPGLDAIIWQQVFTPLSVGTPPIPLIAPPGSDPSFSAGPDGVCAVDENNMLEIIGPGICEVTAFSTIGDQQRQWDLSFTITAAAIAKRQQDPLTLDAPVSLAYKGTGVLTVGGGSTNGKVTFAVAGGCTINENDVPVTITASSGSGECSVDAFMDGNDEYEVATSSTLVFLDKANQSVIWPVLPTTVGASFNVSGITLNSGLTPEVEADPPAVCEKTDDTILLKEPGTCTVTVSHPGDENYNEVSAVSNTKVIQVSVPPQKEQQTITWTQELSATVGDADITLTASASPSNLPVSYVSSTGDVCTVVGDKLKINGAGPFTVTASQAGNTTYAAAASVPKTFTIKAKPDPLIVTSSGRLPYPGSVTLSFSGGIPGATPEYVLDDGPCTLSGNVLTSTDNGTCTVSASMASTASYAAVSSTPLAIGVLLNQTITWAQTRELTFGGSNITLTATASSGLDVSYEASPATICSIVNTNQLKINGAGDCKVTASQAGNDRYMAAVPLEETFSIAKASQSVILPVLPTTVGATFNKSSITLDSGLTPTVEAEPAEVCAETNSGTAVELKGEGNCTVRVRHPGNINYTNVAENVVLVVGFPPKQQQTITWGQTLSATFRDPDITLTATATSSLQVSYAAEPVSICSIVDGNKLKINGLGLCTVTASQAGNATYAAATNVPKTFTITLLGKMQQAVLTLNAPDVLRYANSAELLVAGGTTQGAIAFEVLSGKCIVNDGRVTALSGTGQCVIRATMSGDDDFRDVADDAIIDLQKMYQTVNWPATFPTSVRESLYLNSITLSSELTPNVTVSPPEICEVTAGEVLLKGMGVCAVTVTHGENENYDSVSATRYFAVGAKSQRVQQSILWTQSQTLSATFGDPDITLTATADSDLPVSYETEQSDFCSIVDGNKLKINGAGPCTVTASQSGSLVFEAAAPFEKTFTIAKAQQAELTIDAPARLAYKGSAQLSVRDGSTNGRVTYTSLNDRCTINGNTVTAASGSDGCEIEASMAGNQNYHIVFASATILLDKASQSVVWPSDLTFTVGQETGLPPVNSGLPATYRATPDETGGCEITGETPPMLKFNKPGRCSVTVDQGGDHRFFEISDTNFYIVSAVSKQQQPLSIKPPSEPLTYNDKVSLSVEGGSGTGAVTFQVYSGPCTVSGNEVTAGSGINNCKIRATKAADDSYEAATTPEVTIWLQKRAQDVIWEAKTVFNTGQSLDLKTIPLNSGLPATFSVASTSQGVCAITGSNPGTLQFIAPGNCDLIAGSDGDDNYEGVSRTETFVVKANQTGFTLTIASLSVGQEIRLSATGGQGSGDVAYQSLTPSRCSITDGNLLKGLAAGTCEVTARQFGDGTYNDATVKASVEVTLPAQNDLTVQASGPLAFPGTVSLSAKGGAGTGAVTFQVASGPCTVSGNQLSSTGPGTCRVTATKASDGNFASVTSAQLDVVVGGSLATIEAEDVSRQSMSDLARTMFNFSEYTNRLDERSGGGGTTAFLPQGTSTNGMIAFAASAGQIVAAAGKGDLQVMPTSAQRPDQGYDPYLKTPGSVDVWIDGRFIWRNGADSGGGLDQRAFLGETGVDYLVTENLLIGLSVRLDTNDAKLGGAGGDLDTLGWLAGPYVVWEIATGLQADAKVSYGQSSNDISVVVSGGRFDGSYDTTRWMAEAGLRGRLDVDSIMIEPGVRAAFYRETAEAYTLSGGGGTVKEQQLSMMRLSFDPRLTYVHRTKEGTAITPFLSPQLAVEWKETKGGKEEEDWDVFGVVQGGLSIATEDFSLSTNLTASGLGRSGALSYSAGVNLTIPLN